MQDKIGNSSLSIARSSNHRHLGILIGLATATLVVHVLLGDRYGFHRDELATLNDARHLAWGYVAYPPVTPFFGRASLELFVTSLTGFRFFAALVVLGYSRTFLERHFESCMSSGLVQNRYGVANEETTDHAEIFVCRRLRGSWPEFWKVLRHYG